MLQLPGAPSVRAAAAPAHAPRPAPSRHPPSVHAERQQIRSQSMPTGGRIDAKFPVIVTSYEILLADIKFMAKYQWKYIVVDEVRCGTAHGTTEALR